MKEFVDHTVFMGMNSDDEEVRISSKNFFVERLKKTVFMSLESVGRCDDIVWGFSRKVQDSYYPFMDSLHTIMKVKRIGYSKKDLSGLNKSLPISKGLTLSQARKEKLYTFDKDLLRLGISSISKPKKQDHEKKFPKELEKFYQNSLKLRIKD